MDKLKIKLFRYGNTVVGEIEEQDEELRDKGRIDTSREFGKTIHIVSDKNQNIKILYNNDSDYHYLFIRNSKQHLDKMTFSYSFDNNDDCLQFIMALKSLIYNINRDNGEKDVLNLERVI